MSTSEASVVPKVLTIYKRLVTYRPHLSDQTHRKLVERKLREIYEVQLLPKEIAEIIESHPELIPVRKPAAVKRKTDEDSLCTKRPPREPKKDFPTMDPSRPCSPAQDSKGAVNCNFADSNSVEVEDFPTSTIPVTEIEKHEVGEKKHQLKIYELYQQRQIPYDLRVKRVQGVLNIWTSKHFVQELFSKQNKKNGLYGNLSTSVFERLYAQRKQRNTKKSADNQEWGLHMKKRKEYMLNMQQRKIQGLSANKFGAFPAGTSADIGDDNVNVEEEFLLVCLSDSTESTVESTAKPEKTESDNTTKCSLQNVYRLLEELTLRFNAHLRLCPCKEPELLQ
ncbi:uncharacterized protein [Euwallacea fornicatus]|uniref:uncharacterized protein isoform X2 n=1 Tax=Euwallacea fornicatus TaxID=995702 RepID=UPI00338F6BDC